jgi:hypothetical protein
LVKIKKRSSEWWTGEEQVLSFHLRKWGSKQTAIFVPRAVKLKIKK